MSAWWETLLTVEKVLYCVAVPSTIILIVQTIMLLFGAAGHEGYNPSDTSGIDFDHDFSSLHDGLDIGNGFGGLHGGLDMNHDIGGLHSGLDMNHDIGGLHSGLDMNHDIGDLHNGFDTGHDINGLHNGTEIHHNFDHDIHSHERTGHSQPQDFDTLRIFTLQGIVAFFAMFSWSAIAGISQGVSSMKAILIGIVMGIILMYIVALIIKYSHRLSEDGTFYLRNTLGQMAVVYVPIPPKNSGSGKVNVSINNRFIEVGAVTNEERTIKTGESVRIIDIINDSVVVEIE